MSKAPSKNIQKIMVVFGTRPEAIKVAPLILALKNDPRFKLCTVATGQHREMLWPILEWFNITPDYTLDVMAPKQPLAFLSGKVLAGLHPIMEAEQPDIVMVQGDTTTAFMAALTAYYGYDYFVRNETGQRRHIQIAHIEAGLRTHDNYAPFPEEVNRRLIGHIANWHFAPTATAAEALFQENINTNVFITGNPVIDALHVTVERLGDGATLNLPPELTNDILGKPYILITGHRRESYGEGFSHICKAIAKLSKRYPKHTFIYPVHLNQHVQEPVHAMLGNLPNVILTQPLDYPAFVHVMRHAHLILTDSGGLQEEGPALGKPVLVMREVTERPEGIMSGTCRLVGTSEKSIIDNVTDLLDNPQSYAKMARAANPYGDGLATQRILNLLAGGSARDNTFTPAYAEA
ncbi:MAG: UDP-N-acetylglucosamine 2-epimerase (non-hydrolyzing) [Blastochloris viridis]|uniref:UDP-N-acetylglucosamine 2-epimerase (non-hydrolyzing) n=1 Tax=Blastochloris viridis TaxID=1079 RepID=A0A6N4RCU7_BLAVI|nr:MAG: UDP-N-acetylglucosamine 2-epimerase (non-hydrolyzing) [Blastochloris viridis]